MGSIYEYSLQYKPGVGRCVPEFIMVHEIIPFCAYTDTHFGYAEEGCSGRGVIEYSTKDAFASRIRQIHALEPYTKNTGTEEEPVIVPWTDKEVTAFIDSTWGKTESINAVVDGKNVLEFYFNDYEVEHFFANIGINDDTRSVVPVTKVAPSSNLDFYWAAAPVKSGSSWKQQWAGRAFTDYELAEYKKKKKKQINDERYATIDAGFTSPSIGKVVNSDLISRVNIDQEVIKAVVSTVNKEPTYNVSWRFADGTIENITREQMIVLGEERRSFVESCYKQSWDRKAIVDAATTRAEIDGA